MRLGLFGLLSPQRLRVAAVGVEISGTLAMGPERAPLALTRESSLVVADGDWLTVTGPSGVPVRGERLRVGPGALTVQVGELGPRRLEGVLAVGARRGRLSVRLELAAAELGRAAALAEREPGAGLEAIKAQAVASVSYILANSRRHAAAGFDFCDTTHCQRFAGWDGGGSGTASELAAASDASHQWLAWRGRPVSAYCTADCGGRSVLPSTLWGGAEVGPFVERDDPACRSRPEPEWDVAIPRQLLARAIRAGARRVEAGDPEVTIRLVSSADGIALRFELLGGGSARTASFENVHRELRRLTGRWPIPGRRFRLEAVEDSFRLRGRGRGHLAGLCQRGAAIMAAEGRSFREILAAYFPGAEIRR